MRVVVLSSSYPRFTGDSDGHFVQAEVQELVSDGHDVIVLCPGTTTRPPGTPQGGAWIRHIRARRLFGAPGAWPRLKKHPFYLLDIGGSLLDLFYRHRRDPRVSQADLIIAHWLFPAGLLWAPLVAKANVPLEVVVHGTDLELLLRCPDWLVTTCLRRLASRDASLRFVAHDQKRRLLRRALPSSLRTWVHRAKVAPSPLTLPRLMTRSEARTKLRIDQARRVVVIVGRLIPEKRIRVALAAASLIPDALVVVVGDGPEQAALKRSFAHVQFTGQLPRDQALEWMSAADVLLQASRHEGAPSVVREALVVDTPVVCVEVADLADWAGENANLWLVGG